MDVTVTTDATAAFVWLDTKSDRQGTFSTNGFLLRESSKQVAFYSKTEITDVIEFYGDLTVTHLSEVIL